MGLKLIKQYTIELFNKNLKQGETPLRPEATLDEVFRRLGTTRPAWLPADVWEVWVGERRNIPPPYPIPLREPYVIGPPVRIGGSPPLEYRTPTQQEIQESFGGLRKVPLTPEEERRKKMLRKYGKMSRTPEK